MPCLSLSPRLCAGHSQGLGVTLYICTFLLIANLLKVLSKLAKMENCNHTFIAPLRRGQQQFSSLLREPSMDFPGRLMVPSKRLQQPDTQGKIATPKSPAVTPGRYPAPIPSKGTLCGSARPLEGSTHWSTGIREGVYLWVCLDRARSYRTAW